MSKKGKSAKSSKSARKAKAPARRTARSLMAVAASAKSGVKERVASLNEVTLAASDQDANVTRALDILGNDNEPAEVRMAALEALQTASFSVVAFAPVRGEYLATLRKVATDPNAELRESALGVLARNKDGFAQQKLLEGLQDPGKALVPTETALSLLSFDPHADAYNVARRIASAPPSDDARQEALRLLSADATSAPLFEKLLLDKSEKREVRQLSAAALHSIAPKKFQKRARELVFDPSEYPDIQATSLAAITNFSDPEALANDEPLLKRVDSLSEKSPAKVKQVARRFMTKFKR
ncbi:MAG: hypothetical protein JOZ96_15215 [Acidobacteria bacterium]|nr:hypothetical protein [Acidobacteriota bacterium]